MLVSSLFFSLLSSPLLFFFHVNKPRIRALPWSVDLAFILFSFFLSFFLKKKPPFYCHCLKWHVALVPPVRAVVAVVAVGDVVVVCEYVPILC